jgi:hypothetical protein
MTTDAPRPRHERALLAALAIFSAVNVFCWIRVMPLGEGPDEQSHYEVVLFEAVFRAIPEVGVDDFGARVMAGADGYRSPLYTYSAQPGLSYIVSAAAIELFGDRSPESAIYARVPGIAWAALMPLVVFWGVARMAPGCRRAAVLAATAAAFWPQLTFVFSYTNNDGLTAIAAAALIASWFAGARSGWRTRDALVTGCLTGILLVGKPNGFPIALMAAPAMLLTLRGGFNRGFGRCAAAAGSAVAVSGWWWAIAFQRYGLDLMAEGRADAIRRSLGVAWACGRTYGLSMLETAIGRYPRFYAKTWLHGTLTSGIGEFGKLTIPLPGQVYLIVGALTLLAFAGACVWAWRNRSSESASMRLLQLLVLLLLPLELGLSLYRSWAFDFQAQGRYLFPALFPYFALLGVGLVGSIRRERVRRAAGLAASLVIAGIGLHAFAVTLLEAYRLSLVEFVASSRIAGGVWVVCATAAVVALVLYWVTRDSGRPAGTTPALP